MIDYYLDILKKYYPEEQYKSIQNSEVSQISFANLLDETTDLVYSLNLIAKSLNLKLEIQFVDYDFGVLDRGMPMSCDILDAEEKDTFIIGISIFGAKNLEVTLCESIYLMVQEKLLLDKKIPFDESFIGNDEEFIPFLVISSIYFGYALPLLYRINITGNYVMDGVTNYSYTYFAPIDRDLFLESIVKTCQFKSIDLDELNNRLGPLDKQIRKKIKSIYKKSKNSH